MKKYIMFFKANLIQSFDVEEELNDFIGIRAGTIDYEGTVSGTVVVKSGTKEAAKSKALDMLENKEDLSEVTCVAIAAVDV